LYTGDKWLRWQTVARRVRAHGGGSSSARPDRDALVSPDLGSRGVGLSVDTGHANLLGLRFRRAQRVHDGLGARPLPCVLDCVSLAAGIRLVAPSATRPRLRSDRGPLLLDKPARLLLLIDATSHVRGRILTVTGPAPESFVFSADEPASSSKVAASRSHRRPRRTTALHVEGRGASVMGDRLRPTAPKPSAPRSRRTPG